MHETYPPSIPTLPFLFIRKPSKFHGNHIVHLSYQGKVGTPHHRIYSSIQSFIKRLNASIYRYIPSSSKLYIPRALISSQLLPSCCQVPVHPKQGRMYLTLPLLHLHRLASQCPHSTQQNSISYHIWVREGMSQALRASYGSVGTAYHIISLIVTNKRSPACQLLFIYFQLID